jgi:uncharacterized membrane protein
MDTKHPVAPSSPDLRPESIPAKAPKPPRTIRDRIINGLLLAMPLLLTLYIVGWLYSILDHNVFEPLGGLIMWKLKWTTSISEYPYWFETFVAPILAIITSLVILYLLDLLADTCLHRAVTWTLKRVPLVSHVYNPIREIFQSLEGSDKPQVQRMVLVTFPHPGIKLPAFVTGSCRDLTTGKTLLCLYVPTTPVPTSGFFLLVPEEEVTELNWNTEQTLQAVMSGGLTCPHEISYFSSHNPRNNHPVPARRSSEDQGRSQGS